MKKKQPENTKPEQAVDRKAKQKEELSEIVKTSRQRRIKIFATVLVLLLLIAGAGFVFIYKPYNDGMQLIAKSEQMASQGNYGEALKSLAKAKITAPFIKGMNYRAGMIQLLQMDYFGAEDQFKKEIAAKGHVAGAELALGFLYTVDGVLSDKEIPVESKKQILDELSNTLQIDISLKSDLTTLELADNGKYVSAINHFANARDANLDFVPAANVGLAFAHALDGNREGGMKSYSQISSLKDKFPLLAQYYDSLQPRLGVNPEMVANAGTGEEPPAVPGDGTPGAPSDQMPPLADNPNLLDLPDISDTTPETGIPPAMPSGRTPRLSPVQAFKPAPTVKPFKLTQYTGKKGDLKYVVTLINISESGQTVAREGQTRTMPKTNVEISIIKLSENEIILKENNLYTFKWKRERNTWFEAPDEEKTGTLP